MMQLEHLRNMWGENVMIGYTTLGTNNVAKARAFYDALLATIGARRLMEFGEELGGFTMWGTGMNAPSVVVTKPFNGERAHAGNGNMIALATGDRAIVDQLHAKALELGGSCEGPPGLREPESMGFYAAYFRDLDGNKLCAFNWSAAA
jgi:catechol 2,3-dioxygenase-like lactoylglutathione lyase family enzyme